MKTAKAQARFAPEAAFRYVSGDVSLDFLNTADWTERGLERDRFTEYARIVEWALGAAIVTPAQETHLLARANQHPVLAAAAYDRALQARQVLRRILMASVSNTASAHDVNEFNTVFGAATHHLKIVQNSDGQFARTFAGFGESFDSIQWAVVWAAGELLASKELAQVRVCSGVDCGWMYVDRSRNGLRRWCEMEVCGTAAKNRRRSELRG